MSFRDVDTDAVYAFGGDATTGYRANVPAGTYDVSFDYRNLSSDPADLNSDAIPVGECLYVGP